MKTQITLSTFDDMQFIGASEVIEHDFDDTDFELLAQQDYWACHTATMEAL